MRPEIRVTLLGKFAVQYKDQVLLDHTQHKVQELLAYLILHRGRAHPRETLAELLWGDRDTAQTRKYLRQALWQLHVGLLAIGKKQASRLLHIEPGWIELGPSEEWVDTAVLQSAFTKTRGVKGAELAPEEAQLLVEAVQHYRGDLLEGWHQDWCAYERERFRQMYLSILDKLVDHSEARGEYEAGIAYATLALRCDDARERIHRSLMRLFCLSGDRTAAIRQFERCTVVLHEALDVMPEAETLDLYARIRKGRALDSSLSAQERKSGSDSDSRSHERLALIDASRAGAGVTGGRAKQSPK